MSTAATTTSTRHVVIDSPIGPLTLVRDDDGLTGLYYPGHWTRPTRRPSGRGSSRATTTDSMRRSRSCANTSPANARNSICRSIPLAANGPAGSGSCSPKSPTAAPPRTVRWPAGSVAASARAPSEDSSATTRCRSSSPAIAWSDPPANSPDTPAAWTASNTSSSWRRPYPLHRKHSGNRHEAAVRKRRRPARCHRAAGGARGPRPRRR